MKVRVGEGSRKLRRADLRSETLPAGEWRSSSSPVLLKRHRVACHEDVMRGARVKATRKDNERAVLRDTTRRIGLPQVLQPGVAQSAPEHLDFSWWVLWRGDPLIWVQRVTVHAWPQSERWPGAGLAPSRKCSSGNEFLFVLASVAEGLSAAAISARRTRFRCSP